MTNPTRLSTRSVHAGEERRKPFGSLTTPIIQTSTYTFADTAEVLDFMSRKAARKAGGDVQVRDEYGRYSNPTQSVAERRLADLEGGEHGLLFSTGMAALTTTMLTLLQTGQHMVLVRGCYRRTRDFALDALHRWGIETTVVGIDRPAEWQAALRPETRLIVAETPTNPHLRVMDLAALSELARQRGIVTLVDSTFATPINLRPLEWGIDLVMHSASKYLAGHNDLLAGVIVGPRRLTDEIEAMRGLLGCTGSPHDAYLLLRGLKTLALRVRQQNASAQSIAEFLQNHPAIERVYYPGLPTHPDHPIAARQMSDFGGVVSFEVRGSKEQTSRVIDALQIPYIGPTLGGVESIVQQQALLISLDEQERRAAGIADTLIRYAVGIEDTQDLIADLQQAICSIQGETL